MNKKNDFFVNCYGNNLAMFSVYKWQSIKLLWSKCKFWDFSILTMTSKMAHYKLQLQRKQRRDIHWYLINLYYTKHAKFCAESKFNCLNVLRLAQAHFANRGGKSFSWLVLSLLKTSLKYWIEVKVYWELFYFHSLVCLVFNKIEPHVTTLGVCNRVRSRS